MAKNAFILAKFTYPDTLEVRRVVKIGNLLLNAPLASSLCIYCTS